MMMSMNNWDASRITRLLEVLRSLRGDTTDVEIKKASGGIPENLAETVCAFANMPDGGTIILGVDEHRNFEVVGVSDPASMIAGIVSQTREVVSPAPFINAYGVHIRLKNLVVVEVHPLPLAERPARVHGTAYLRQADGDYSMHEHELRMLEQEKNTWSTPVHFDAQTIPGSSVEDLVPDLVESYSQQVKKVDRRLASRDEEEILRRTNVVASTGELTLAGLYTLGDYPQGFLPSLTVTAAVQLPRGARARTRNLQDFTGPLPILLADIMSWCEENVATLRRYRGDGNMEEDYELPLRAIREVVANALVHRDLSPNTLEIGKSIQIRLNSRNLMVLSPGGLHGVSLEQITSVTHAQAAVNQRLYSIAKKLSTPDSAPVIEGEGGGIAETLEAAASYGLPTPTFIDTGVQFTALLWRPHNDPPTASGLPGLLTQRREQPIRIYRTPLKKDQTNLDRHAQSQAALSPLRNNQELVLSALENDEALSIQELQTRTGLTRPQVRYALRHSIGQQTVEMIGRQGSKNTQYRLLSRE